MHYLEGIYPRDGLVYICSCGEEFRQKPEMDGRTQCEFHVKEHYQKLNDAILSYIITRPTIEWSDRFHVSLRGVEPK